MTHVVFEIEVLLMHVNSFGRGASLLVVSVLAALATAACREEPEPSWIGELTRATAEAANSGDVLVVKDAVDFPWDRLYLFGPYSDSALIDRALGARVEWASPLRDSLRDRDDVCLLVFVREAAVVEAGLIPRADLDCDPVAVEPTSVRSFTPAEARFPVKIEAGRTREVYVLGQPRPTGE